MHGNQLYFVKTKLLGWVMSAPPPPCPLDRWAPLAWALPPDHGPLPPAHRHTGPLASASAIFLLFSFSLGRPLGIGICKGNDVSVCLCVCVFVPPPIIHIQPFFILWIMGDILSFPLENWATPQKRFPLNKNKCIKPSLLEPVKLNFVSICIFAKVKVSKTHSKITKGCPEENVRVFWII